MPKVAIISDSHIPGRAAGIPPRFQDRITAADHVIHAGDFTSAEALETVRELADGALTAVAGNMDGAGLGLPSVATVELGGVTFVVTHGTGSPAGYGQRVAGIVRDAAGPDAVGVAGHTHEVLNAEVDDVHLLNPGSVTGAAPAQRESMMTADVTDGAIEVIVHE